MGNKRDYYTILGVNRDVGETELKSAYRKLAKKYHPDANPDNPNAEAKMREIIEAYAVLSDAQKKAEYDGHGHTAPRQGRARKDSGPFSGGFGSSANINFDDLFGMSFGDIFNDGRKKNKQKRGHDVSLNIQIDYEEAISGAKKEVTFNFSEICGLCNGTGSMSGAAVNGCECCNGSGLVRETIQSGFGKMKQTRECPVCRDKGKGIKEPCSKCSGSGLVKLNKKILVKIPKGIKSGQSISIDGMGEPGEQGGPRGNLLIKVSFRPKSGS